LTEDQLTNYSEDHILNTEKALRKQREQTNVCSFYFHTKKIYTGYEDGIICCWSSETGELSSLLLGHTNRINALTGTDQDKIFSCSNDCTVRMWNSSTGVCENIFKFGDPVSDIAISITHNMMYTASWDKMVRVIDLEASKVIKSFVASKEAIKKMLVTDTMIFVAGCDPIIRGFDLETGDTKEYQGHTGWVYDLKVQGEHLFSGGDDKSIKVWDIESTKMVDELLAHENGVTCLTFANNDLYTGSFDHYIYCWDLPEIKNRIVERDMMREEDIRSRKIEVFSRLMFKKKKKGGKRKAGKKRK